MRESTKINGKYITAGNARHSTPAERRSKLMSDFSKDKSLFNTDKRQLIEFVLDKYGAKFNPTRSGWQKVRCFNEAAHLKGDRHPSGSVHLDWGHYRCFSCDLSGDGYSILRELEGWGVKQVNDAFGGEVIPSDERGTWL
jgi:hypothetical protein